MKTVTKSDIPYYEKIEFKPITNGLILYCTSDDSDNIWTNLNGYSIINTSTAVRNYVHSSLVFGNGTWFNGTSHYGKIDPIVVGNLPQFTISALFKSKGTVQGNIYAETNNISNNATIGLRVNYTTSSGVVYLGTVRFRYIDNTGVDGSITSADIGIDDNMWHDATAVQYNKYGRELFVDSVSRGTNSISVGDTTNLNIASFGATIRSTITDFLSGKISRLMIYNRALTPTEILYNYTHSSAYYIKNSII